VSPNAKPSSIIPHNPETIVAVFMMIGPPAMAEPKMPLCFGLCPFELRRRAIYKRHGFRHCHHPFPQENPRQWRSAREILAKE
jgi:hypothetical protein